MFQYFSDDEYRQVFTEFEGIRGRIADLLQEQANMREGTVLDLLAGHGYLTAELARVFRGATIYATGLSNDLQSFLTLQSSEEYPLSTWENVNYTECDVTSLPFDDLYFDLVANFLGLEDVMMTRGEEGLISVFSEVARVLKTGGVFEMSVVEYEGSPEERIAEEVWSTIGLNAVFLDREFYIMQAEKNGLVQKGESLFTIRKKMTYHQASEELRFACEEAPRIFKEYGVTAINFSELMEQFGPRIRKHGMAYYPNIRALIFQKEV